MANGFAGLRQALLTRDAQFVLQMNVGGRQKNVNARVRGSLQCLPGAVHVAGASASQARDDGTAQSSGDALHGFKVAIGGDGEPSLDYVDAKAVELLGQMQFFLHIHTAARRLLAVTKRGVEDSNARPVHGFGTSRGSYLFTLSASGGERKGYYVYRSISLCDSIRITYQLCKVDNTEYRCSARTLRRDKTLLYSRRDPWTLRNSKSS